MTQPISPRINIPYILNSKIPNAKRTNNVLNNIHIMITRFIQLRQISSTFDTNKNIKMGIKHLNSFLKMNCIHSINRMSISELSNNSEYTSKDAVLTISPLDENTTSVLSLFIKLTENPNFSANSFLVLVNVSCNT